MTMTAIRVVALCERNAYTIREDLALIEAGRLRFQMFGADVTLEQVDRMRANLSRLEEIIEACGCHCA